MSPDANLNAKLGVTFRVAAVLLVAGGILAFIGAEAVETVCDHLYVHTSSANIRVVAALVVVFGILVLVAAYHSGGRWAKLLASCRAAALLVIAVGIAAFVARIFAYREEWSDYRAVAQSHACIVSTIGRPALERLFKRADGSFFSRTERAAWNEWGASKGATLRWRRHTNLSIHSSFDDLGAEDAASADEALELSALVVPACNGAEWSPDAGLALPTPGYFWDTDRAWASLFLAVLGTGALGVLAWVRWLFARPKAHMAVAVIPSESQGPQRPLSLEPRAASTPRALIVLLGLAGLAWVVFFGCFCIELLFMAMALLGHPNPPHWVLGDGLAMTKWGSCYVALLLTIIAAPFAYYFFVREFRKDRARVR
jgi:hypothetical protein